MMITIVERVPLFHNIDRTLHTIPSYWSYWRTDKPSKNWYYKM